MAAKELSSDNEPNEQEHVKPQFGSRRDGHGLLDDQIVYLPGNKGDEAEIE